MTPETQSFQTVKRLGSLALASAILIFLVIVLGGIVRVTESGGACPDWPTCFGQWTPPSASNAVLDYLHRLATLLVAPLALAGGWIAWRKRKEHSLLAKLLVGTVILLGVQVGLGAFITVEHISNDQGWVSALHLGLSLLVQALVAAAVVIAFYQRRTKTLTLRLSFRSPFARLSLLAAGAVFLLMISGAVVAAGSESAGAVSFACPGWPLCGGVPDSTIGWIHLIHRLLVGLAGLFVAGSTVLAWRSQRSQPAVLASATVAGVLFVSQALLGAKMVAGFPAYLLALHEATAVAVWVALAVQATAIGLANRSAEDERQEAHSRTLADMGGIKGMVRDFLMLTKPIVVLLLLVTTYAGMVIGAQAWPSLSLTFWTLLGGFMASGGSGAINQYIDRFDDGKMQRTQKRPIPSKRLEPAEGLAFGLGLTVASFYLMVAFVNFLAALLTLAGIIYYVLIYSIFLKKTTVQNIVIGGGSGAIPPLVGWAAATGSLNVPSLLLFALIFMWTPPHFWALALVRRKDYARAGVPMLPVVRGEEETRRQIFLYTVEMVVLTLLLPLFGLGGSIYLIGAVVLGLWLLGAAYRLKKEGGNKVAWKMYRYSSMYLAFIFFVLMIDRLL